MSAKNVSFLLWMAHLNLFHFLFLKKLVWPKFSFSLFFSRNICRVNKLNIGEKSIHIIDKESLRNGLVLCKIL